jgi:hypothetical protein
MRDAWQILRDGGLPLAAPRSGVHPEPAALAAAVRTAIASNPDGRDADALAAFVFAWHHHWPTSFATELGGASADVLDWARAHTPDADRYLKLRRIAVENLATVL